MEFSKSKDLLLDIFTSNNFDNNVINGNTHATEFVVEICSTGSKISVSFPGYKSEIRNGKTIYDYRIDILKNESLVALSHSNIVTDIYNKIVNGNMIARDMAIELAKAGVDSKFDLEQATRKLKYNSVIPTTKIISRVHSAHKGKFYNKTGNSFDLTIEELFTCIKWIVIQEDINYPISKNFEGRRMSFYRYIEAAFVAQNNLYSLEDVISRTLSHSRSQKWGEISYKFSSKIK
jgi:hypothetical protein